MDEAQLQYLKHFASIEFKNTDTDHSGSIDSSELSVMLKNVCTAFGYDEFSPDEVADTLKMVDVDENGTLNKQEFIALVTEIVSSAQEDGKFSFPSPLPMLEPKEDQPKEQASKTTKLEGLALALFHEVDTNQSGTVDINELTSCLGQILQDFDYKVPVNFSAHAVIPMMNKYDVNHSGSLNFTEFYQVVKSIINNLIDDGKIDPSVLKDVQDKRSATQLDLIEKVALEQFAIADVDGSGSIDANELAAIVRSVTAEFDYPVPDDGTIRAMMAELDADNSGALNATEFFQLVKIIIDSLVRDGKIPPLEDSSVNPATAPKPARVYLTRMQKIKRLSDTVFEEADTDSSGAVDSDELAGMVKAITANVGYPVPDDATVASMMAELDTDGSGTLSADEWFELVKIMVESLIRDGKIDEIVDDPKPKTQRSRIQALALEEFTQTDIDGSGSIDVTELAALVLNVTSHFGYPEPSANDILTMMDELDTDQSGALNVQEFTKLCEIIVESLVRDGKIDPIDNIIDDGAETRTATSSDGKYDDHLAKLKPSFVAAFRAADSDNSGALDVKELATVLASVMNTWEFNEVLSQPECEGLLADLDTNNDGVLNLNEFIQLCKMIIQVLVNTKKILPLDQTGGEIRIPTPVDPKEQLVLEFKREFRRTDKDRSGSVDASELYSMCSNIIKAFKVEADLNRGTINRLHRNLDSDRSGSLEEAEFIRFCHILIEQLVKDGYIQDPKTTEGKIVPRKKAPVVDEHISVAPRGRKSALLVVDMQNDWIDGSVAIPKAKALIPLINRLRSEIAWDMVVWSKDFHPQGHISFYSTHTRNPRARICQALTLPNGIEQVLWPDHCIQNTKGCKLHPDLTVDTKRDVFVEKGTNVGLGSYSAFYDAQKAFKTPLSLILNENNITDVYVVGVAMDMGVGASALDAAAEGFNTFVVEDATKWMVEEDAVAIQTQFERKNIQVIQSLTLLEEEREDRREAAAQYMKKHQIHTIFERLCTALVFHKPDNPKKVLIEEIQNMQQELKENKSKKLSSLGSFTEEDYPVLFNMMDPVGKGNITSYQASKALADMGLLKEGVEVRPGNYTVHQFTELCKAAALV